MTDKHQLELRSHPNGKPIGWVDTPPRGRGQYAVLIEGDALYPTARHGACLIVEEGGPCAPGELVLIRLTAGYYLVHELVAERGDFITVLPATGGARTTIARADVAAMDPVAYVASSSKYLPD